MKVSNRKRRFQESEHFHTLHPATSYEKYEHDRGGYADADTEFINKYAALAREESGGRYRPQK